MQSFHLYLYGTDCGPIATTFESAAARLQALPRLYLEPDGSFVWTQVGGSEQIFGMLYDAEGQLQYVELRGQCKRPTWRQLVLAIIGSDSGGTAQDVADDHRLDAKGPIGSQRDGLLVMNLPGRQLQELQRFEETAFC
ncbi:MAG: hypothetical protein HKN47_04370 [Pirellulaceae bacterium]|nr:hypothetical protein [Pirellulaceae bacterium]